MLNEMPASAWPSNGLSRGTMISPVGCHRESPRGVCNRNPFAEQVASMLSPARFVGLAWLPAAIYLGWLVPEMLRRTTNGLDNADPR